MGGCSYTVDAWECSGASVLAWVCTFFASRLTLAPTGTSRLHIINSPGPDCIFLRYALLPPTRAEVLSWLSRSSLMAVACSLMISCRAVILSFSAPHVIGMMSRLLPHFGQPVPHNVLHLTQRTLSLLIQSVHHVLKIVHHIWSV